MGRRVADVPFLFLNGIEFFLKRETFWSLPG
jgi:hypothetical protein